MDTASLPTGTKEVLETSTATESEYGLPADVPGSQSPIEAVSQGAAPDRNDVWLWLRAGDQLFVTVLATALLVLLGVHWLSLSHWGADSVELSSQQPREYYYSLDINSASWVEWAQLEQIGEKRAREIVADRDRRGPFRNPADVGRVKGIGPKILEKIMPFLRGGTDSQATGAN